MRTAWTSFTSSWQSPGRPRTAVNHRRTSYRGQQLLSVLLVVAVSSSSVSSAPLSLSSSHHHLQEQQQQSVLSEKVRSLPLTDERLQSEEEGEHREREERAIRTSGRWTNATIPFSFDKSTLTLVQRNRIIKAMKVWQKKTCVRFVERTKEDFFVRIYRNDASCVSDVGMKPFNYFRGRGQVMQLSQTYCLEAKDRGKVVHELGHVIGFYHEHQRPDRDEYIEILWDNLINSDAIRSQYEIEPHTDNLGTDYDYNSVMHYGPTDNSANGNATMVIFDERFADKVGQRTRPSSTDYRQVNLFYNCIHDEGDAEESNMSVNRPSLLPSSANDVRSGDDITLSPEVNSSKVWWLNCTDTCMITDAAGKKFKSNDVSNCSELIFEMQKVVGADRTEYIKVGDTVALKHRLTTGDITIVSCTDERQCASKSRCIAGDNEAGAFDETVVCEDDLFVVGAVGKTAGQPVSHRDKLTFQLVTSANSDSNMMMRSWMKCEIDDTDSGGECSKQNCYMNEIGNEAAMPELVECGDPFTFLLTKL